MKQFVVSREVFEAGNIGICHACGTRYPNTSPGTLDDDCPKCGEPSLCGLDQLEMLGMLSISDGEKVAGDGGK